MEKRKIEVDIKTAKEWFNSGVKFKRELALLAFTEKELTINQLPKSWQEFTKDGYLSSRYFTYSKTLDTVEHLLILRDVYRQGWKPDWNMRSEAKYCIMLNINILEIHEYFDIAYLFSFPTKELAGQFLANFRNELEELKNLL